MVASKDYEIFSEIETESSEEEKTINFKDSIIANYTKNNLLIKEMEFTGEDINLPNSVPKPQADFFKRNFIKKDKQFNFLAVEKSKFVGNFNRFFKNKYFEFAFKSRKLGIPKIKAVLEKDCPHAESIQGVDTKQKPSNDLLSYLKSQKFIPGRKIVFITDEQISALSCKNKLLYFKTRSSENNEFYFFCDIFYESFTLNDLVKESVKNSTFKKMTSLRVYELKNYLFYVVSFSEFYYKRNEWKMFGDFEDPCNCDFYIKGDKTVEVSKNFFESKNEAVELDSLPKGDYIYYNGIVYKESDSGSKFECKGLVFEE